MAIMIGRCSKRGIHTGKATNVAAIWVWEINWSIKSYYELHPARRRNKNDFRRCWRPSNFWATKRRAGRNFKVEVSKSKSKSKSKPKPKPNEGMPKFWGGASPPKFWALPHLALALTLTLTSTLTSTLRRRSLHPLRFWFRFRFDSRFIWIWKN